MPDRRRRNCTCCGKSFTEVGSISWNGNCITCAVALEEENNYGIAEQRGPAHARRIRGYERYIERMRSSNTSSAA